MQAMILKDQVLEHIIVILFTIIRLLESVSNL